MAHRAEAYDALGDAHACWLSAPAELRRAVLPEPGRGEVVVRIGSSSRCASRAARGSVTYEGPL